MTKRLQAAIISGLATFTAPFAYADTIKLLAMGDSLTAGYGLAQPDGFVPQLQRWLDVQGADVQVINAGVSGDTTAGGAARLGWSLSDDIDVVLVNLGGNDMLRGLPPAETRRNLEHILSDLKARNLPTILIRVPGSLNFGLQEKKAYDNVFSELSTTYQTHFIPNYFHALETQHDRQSTLNTLMQADGIHPSAAGVALIVDDIGPAVLGVLSDEGG